MEPDILSQVNRTCPPVQTDTIPNGDSVMDVPVTDKKKLATSYITRTLENQDLDNCTQKPMLI